MNKESLLQIFTAHRPALLDYAASILGSAERAEDVLQEAWLRFAAAPREEMAQPVHYLYRIVRNLALDLLRRQALEGRYSAPFEHAAEVGGAGPDPERQAISQEELQRVTEALDELPERTREAFRLVRLHGLTLHQAAEQLGISVGLAHALVRSALLHLTVRLEGSDRRPPGGSEKKSAPSVISPDDNEGKRRGS